MQTNNNNYLSSNDKSKIYFTLMEGKNIGKSYHIGDNNTLIKSTQGKFWEGTFRTFKGDHKELNDFIKLKWNPNMFIVQGLIHDGLEEGIMPNDAQRTKEHFPFQDYPGLLIIDSDSVNDFGIKTMEELRDALISIEPALEDVPMYMSPSASSNIYLDGRLDNGLRGVHTFIPVKSTIDNKRIIETLHKKSILSDYVNVGISKAGTPLIRSLVDTAMKSPNQPCFSSRAKLNDGRLSQDVVCISWNEDNNILDPKDIKDLSSQNEIKVKNKIKRLHDDALGTPECKKAKETWEREQTLKIQEKSPDMSLEQIKATLKQARRGQLYIDAIITLVDDEEIKVLDILEDKEKYHGRECLHPLEHEHHAKAVIYSKQDNPCIHSFAHGGEVFYLKRKEMDEWELDRIELEERIEEFNERHAVVVLGSQCVVVRENHTTEDGAPTNINHEYFTDVNLKKIHAGDFVYFRDEEGDKTIKKSFVNVWLAHPLCRKYKERVVCDPDNEYSYESGIYNTWQGFTVEPREHNDTETVGALKLIDYHIKNVLCDGEVDTYDYFTKWIAWGFQNKGQRIGTAIVAIGGQGVGKSMFGEFLKDIWGRHGVMIDNGDLLTGRFNAVLDGACFALCEEAFFHGNKQQINSLKSKITSKVLTVERKNIDPYEVKNMLKVFMCTNERHAISAGVDERRYCVLNVSDRHKGDVAYFKRLAAVFRNQKVRETFLHKMENIKLDDFVVGVVPETKGLKNQRLESLDSVGKFLVDGLNAGGYDIRGCDEWREEIKPNDFFKSYQEYCKTNVHNSYDRKSQTAFGSLIKDIFPKVRKQNEHYYVIGGYRDAVSRVKKYYKISIDSDVSQSSTHTGDVASVFFNNLIEENNDVVRVKTLVIKIDDKIKKLIGRYMGGDNNNVVDIIRHKTT